MYKTRARSFPVLMITLAFFVGLGWFVFNLATHGAEWVSLPQNGHLSENGALEHAGSIIDRNGVVLAHSAGGKRIYHEDPAVRTACVHVVGDNTVNITTAVQNLYRSELTGYHFAFGQGLPNEWKEGASIRLTLDSNMQTAACRALGDRKGAAVVYNYRTGEILCLASTPGFDPENKPEDIETNEAYDGAYLNRAISSAYPPGSTFKLVTAAEALESIPGAEKITYHCEAEEDIGGAPVTCYAAFGDVDFKHALMYSCNLYFAHLAVDLGGDKMTARAQRCGFNACRSFDRITTAKSVYDVSQASVNDLAWSGVGQYTVLETPLNMAIRAAAIADGGTPMMPYLVEEIRTADGSVQKAQHTRGSSMMSPATADTLKEMMDYTVANFYDKSVFSDVLDVCAKTGTAEVGEAGEPHGWITGFCTSEEAPFAFAVIVEHGESGYGSAVPVASAILKAWEEEQKTN